METMKLYTQSVFKDEMAAHLTEVVGMARFGMVGDLGAIRTAFR